MKVFILTEGGEGIGLGHATRCVSLYQAFRKKGIRPEMLVNFKGPVSNVLNETKHTIFDWLREGERLNGLVKAADIVVIDSYLAGLAFYKRMARTAKLPVYIDDVKRLDYPAGVVVNGAIYSERIKYPHRKGTVYLLGARYAFLRKEFCRYSEKKIEKDIANVLIAFGGEDLRGMTSRVVRFLRYRCPRLKKNVILNKRSRWARAVERLKDTMTNIIYSPGAEETKQVMLKTDLAISACGQTLYELARIGVPTIGICTAENQSGNISGFRTIGFLEYAGWYNDGNILEKLENCIWRLNGQSVRMDRAAIGKRHIDGSGAKRVVEKLL